MQEGYASKKQVHDQNTQCIVYSLITDIQSIIQGSQQFNRLIQFEVNQYKIQVRLENMEEKRYCKI